jgi:protein phosphatase 2C-like protein
MSEEPSGVPWRFDRIDSVSQAGKSINEDRATASTGAAWILDGATGLSPQRLFPGPSDPAWFAATADALLARLTRESADSATLLRRLVAELQDACAAAALVPLADTEIELPSASLAAAQIMGGQIDLLMLGDCKLLLRQSDGRVEAFDQSSVAPFDAKVVEALRAIRAGGETALSEITPRLMPLIRENRRWKNRPGGYGVLTADPACLAFAETARRPAAAATHLLLATDGFYRLVDTYSMLTAGELMQAALERGLAPLYAELRRIEDADPECLAFPRFKARDDATAVVVGIARR